VGAAAATATEMARPGRLPLDGGYAPAGNPSGWSQRGGLRTFWHIPTDKPWVALTFDDGPEPNWTPRVLDTLEKLEAPATFFVVGDRLARNAHLVRGRYERHEVANHTWTHQDLARLGEAPVRDELARCHDAIVKVTGLSPKLMRPPWGHLGGSTLTVADEFGYDLAMWSYVMPEKRFEADPEGIVGHVVAAARPGLILLAHDTGDNRRLVVLNRLDKIVAGLRAKGLELVTVSQLLTAAASPF
jgi:peptidoglycan/xylan/chitin deacetylase (PgdA/CDA1 family)